jgi:hypothetical protein
MGGGGGDIPEEQTHIIRYAPYIESHHQQFLNIVANKRDAIIDESPYEGYTAITYEDAFFGSGYTLASFPSIYDMFGKFMAGLDIDSLFTQILNDSLSNVAIDNAVSAHAIELSDDIEQNASPRLVTGLRDINSVLSSSFIVGKAMLETARIKALSKYSADLDKAMIPIANERWKTHLGWNTSVISMYGELMKLYFTAAMDLDNHNYGMVAKDRLWPFTVLDYVRACLGALQGAQKQSSSVAGSSASDAQKAVSGAMTGAAGGAMIGAQTGFEGGGVWGAVIGGVLGAAASFL